MVFKIAFSDKTAFVFDCLRANDIMQKKKTLTNTYTKDVSMNNNDKMRTVSIRNFPVELNKLLKFENLVQSGGEAKTVILEGRVKVNGEVETRIRKKIYKGDIVVFGAGTIRVLEEEEGS